jgi:hypothetical protein
MAMQYCPGATLKEARNAMRAPPDEAWLRAFVEPILGALETLHHAGVFHRDISPDNILLLPNGRPILLDFGSARRVIGQGTRLLTAVLKPNFAPIEQYGDETGMAQGPWTDLYALGATVHFMLTGEAPTPAVLRVVKDLRRPLASAGPAAFPGVGTKFLAAIDWAAAVAPSDRPQSAAALREAPGNDEPRAPPAPAPTAGRRPGPRAGGGGLRRALAVGAWTLGSATCSLRLGRRMSVPAQRKVSRPATSAVAAGPAAGHVKPASPSVAIPVPETAAAPARPDKAPAPVQRPSPPKRSPAAKPMQPAAPASLRTEGTAVESRSPNKVCADRNFFARAICVSRQCQAAGSRMAPECVEARRIEEQRQRRIDP